MGYNISQYYIYIYILMIMIYCDNICVVYHGISVYITSPKPKPLVSHIQKQSLACCVLAGDKPINYQHGTDSFMSYGLLLQTR